MRESESNFDGVNFCIEWLFLGNGNIAASSATVEYSHFAH